MRAPDTGQHDWQAGETEGIIICPRHDHALLPMEFDRAWNIAEDCLDCVTVIKGRAG